MTRRTLMPELLKLSTAERILLAQDLWDSLADSPDADEPTAAQRRELDRRLEADRRDPSRGDAWEVVKRRLNRREPATLEPASGRRQSADSLRRVRRHGLPK